VEGEDADARLFKNLLGAREVPGRDEPAVGDDERAREAQPARRLAEPPE
jgi:hypothetical protein